jgi:hypothetical protein
MVTEFGQPHFSPFFMLCVQSPPAQSIPYALCSVTPCSVHSLCSVQSPPAQSIPYALCSVTPCSVHSLCSVFSQPLFTPFFVLFSVCSIYTLFGQPQLSPFFIHCSSSAISVHSYTLCSPSPSSVHSVCTVTATVREIPFSTDAE